MPQLSDVIQWQAVLGDTLTVGDAAVTPQSQALTVRWSNGGFVWNRPVAIWVERAGETQRIPVVDVTRLAQWGLLGLGLVFSLITLVASNRRRRLRNE